MSRPNGVGRETRGEWDGWVKPRPLLINIVVVTVSSWYVIVVLFGENTIEGMPCLFKSRQPTRLQREENGKRRTAGKRGRERQERQEISIGRKSKSMGGRGWDFSGWEGGILWGSPTIHFKRRNEVSARPFDTSDVPTYTLYTPFPLALPCNTERVI